MKIALALLALVATAASANVPSSEGGREDLAKEIQDFLAIIPQKEIVEVTVRYMNENEDFQNMIKYFQSEEFKNLVKDVEGLKEIHELMDYMYDANFDIYAIINAMNDALGLAHLKPHTEALTYKTNGIRKYLDEVEALLPVEKMRALYDDKMKNSPVWRDFINQLKSEKFQHIVNVVYKHPTVQKLIERAREVGIDLKLIVKLLKEFLGISIPGRS